MEKQKQPDVLVSEDSDPEDGLLDPSQIGEEAELFRRGLDNLIIGQTEALDQLLTVYQKWRSGMNDPGRPISNMLFLGPTGVGKTACVEAVATALLGDARAVLKIDCAEFQHSHDIAKLIGSPPGYLGHRETHPLLSQEALNQYHTDKIKISFVLFDEIEKASDALWNLLLGIMDKGVMTLGDNRRVDFSKAMIFMTGNIGAAEISKASVGTGFAPPVMKNMEGSIKSLAQTAARRKFTPEFMNRIDHVIVFNSLGESEMERILYLELNIVQQRIFNSARTTPFIFRVDPKARKMLMKHGVDNRYGARYLKRTISRMLTNPLSNLIASGQIKGGDVIEIGVLNQVGVVTPEDKLSFRLASSGMQAVQMADIINETMNSHAKAATQDAGPETARNSVDSSRKGVVVIKKDRNR